MFFNSRIAEPGILMEGFIHPISFRNSGTKTPQGSKHRSPRRRSDLPRKASMTSVEKYLKHLHDIRSSGDATDETSYYTPLNNLLDDVGKTLKPRPLDSPPGLRCGRHRPRVSAAVPSLFAFGGCSLE